MNIGLIAEYNPFHNGHYYQINSIRKLFPDKKILVIMSGDFVQRGEPAIFNKYLRAKCALVSGADILFELPPLFSTSSAEYFARAAVLSLARTNVIDTLCFGAENDELEIFKKIAQLLLEEPTSYKNSLKENLKNGYSFPKARANAIAQYFNHNKYTDFLSKPNNILGIEYIKTIYKYNLPIKPYIIKRKGSDYHQTSLTNTLSSALAIRNYLYQETHNTLNNSDSKHTLTRNTMPKTCYNEIKKHEYNQPLFIDDFYPFIKYALWQENDSFEHYFEVTKELSNTLINMQNFPINCSELISELSNKNYTHTRIKRALFNILFKNTKENMATLEENNLISYLRLLGFKASSSNILKEINQESTLPMVNKVAHAKKMLNQQAYSYFKNDLKISQLYKQIYANKYQINMPTEYEQSVIIINENHNID